MATLHWELRDLLPELRDEGRLNTLIAMLLHANIRLRCYPSLDLLVKETGFGIEAVNRAKNWLIKRGLAVKVPYKLRVDEERKLPNRQNVYQLTGVYALPTGEILHYLYMTPEAFNELQARIQEIQKSHPSTTETSVSETSTTETSAVEVEGISSIKGVSTSKGKAISKGNSLSPDGDGARAAAPPKKSRKEKKPTAIEEKAKANDGQEEPSSPGSGAPSSPKRVATLGTTTHYDVYLALIKQWRHDPAKVTKALKGQFMGVAADLHRVDITPERIPDLCAYIGQRAKTERWKGWTVSVLPKYANDFLLACPAASEQAHKETTTTRAVFGVAGTAVD